MKDEPGDAAGPSSIPQQDGASDTPAETCSSSPGPVSEAEAAAILQQAGFLIPVEPGTFSTMSRSAFTTSSSKGGSLAVAAAVAAAAVGGGAAGSLKKGKQQKCGGRRIPQQDGGGDEEEFYKEEEEEGEEDQGGDGEGDDAGDDLDDEDGAGECKKGTVSGRGLAQQEEASRVGNGKGQVRSGRALGEPGGEKVGKGGLKRGQEKGKHEGQEKRKQDATFGGGLPRKHSNEQGTEHHKQYGSKSYQFRLKSMAMCCLSLANYSCSAHDVESPVHRVLLCQPVLIHCILCIEIAVT